MIEQGVKNKRISKLIKDRIYFDKFLARIKGKPSNDDRTLTLFVLQVAQLEYNLKRFIGKDDAFLGTVIKEWYEKVKNVDQTKIRDYRVKSLFHSKYIESFKKCSYEINKLRNNLYHNLFRGANDDHGLKEMLRRVKKRIENRTVSYQIDPEFYKNLRGLVKTTNYRSLIDGHSMPKSWTIELLIEASRYYKKF